MQMCCHIGIFSLPPFFAPFCLFLFLFLFSFSISMFKIERSRPSFMQPERTPSKPSIVVRTFRPHVVSPESSLALSSLC